MADDSNQINRTPHDLLKHPRFDEKEVVYRWRKDWWDGPLNGLISYRGQRYWFDFYCETDEPGEPRYFLAFPLSEEEANFADAWSDENERHRDEWKRLAMISASPPSEETARRWESHDASLPDLSDRPPVGWFIDGQNSSFYAIQIQRG
jgi:hypothetical protein